MLPIQIILICLFVLFALGAVSRARRAELTKGEAAWWVLLWMAGAVFSALPDATFYFSKLLGVGRGADLVVYGALAILFFFQFKLLLKIEKQNREITLLTRKLAIKDNDEKKV